MTKVNDVITDGIHLGKVWKRANGGQKQKTWKVGCFRDTSASGNYSAKIWCFSLLMLFIWVFVNFNPATRKWYLSMRFGTKLSICWRLDQKSCKWSELGAATTRSWQRILYFTGFDCIMYVFGWIGGMEAQFLNYLHVDGNARPFSSFVVVYAELLEPTVGLKCWVAIAIMTFFNHIYLFASRRVAVDRCWAHAP